MTPQVVGSNPATLAILTLQVSMIQYTKVGLQCRYIDEFGGASRWMDCTESQKQKFSNDDSYEFRDIFVEDKYRDDNSVGRVAD